MSYKSLLTVHFLDDTPDRLDPIISIAQNMGAHLNIIVMGILPPPASSTYAAVPDNYWSVEYDRVLKDCDTRVALVKKMITASGVSASALPECKEFGMIFRTMARHALYCDLTLIPARELLSRPALTEAFNGPLFESGRGVLLVPDGMERLPEGAPTVFAWDGSPEAARAFMLALPLMKTGSAVDLAIVDPGSDRGPRPGDDMATYLTRHQLEVQVSLLASSGRSAAEVIRERATDVDAGLIVMGGYGHSRIQEWLLGGTTRDMLHEPHLPILFAH